MEEAQSILALGAGGISKIWFPAENRLERVANVSNYEMCIRDSPNAVGPSIDWLKIAKSSSARNKIRQWLKKENKTDAVDKGKDLIDRYMRKKGYDPRELLKNAFVNKAVKALGYKNTDELYTQLSNGGSLQSKLDVYKRQR